MSVEAKKLSPLHVRVKKELGGFGSSIKLKNMGLHLDTSSLDEDKIKIKMGDRPDYGLPSLTEKKAVQTFTLDDEDFFLSIVPMSDRSSVMPPSVHTNEIMQRTSPKNNDLTLKNSM